MPKTDCGQHLAEISFLAQNYFGTIHVIYVWGIIGQQVIHNSLNTNNSFLYTFFNKYQYLLLDRWSLCGTTAFSVQGGTEAVLPESYKSPPVSYLWASLWLFLRHQEKVLIALIGTCAHSPTPTQVKLIHNVLKWTDGCVLYCILVKNGPKTGLSVLQNTRTF